MRERCPGPVLLSGAALLAMTLPAFGSGLTDWNVSPYETMIGDDLALRVTGAADGSAYFAGQPDAPGLDQDGVTGAAWMGLSLERDYDSGLAIALKSTFEVYHDRLSGDNLRQRFRAEGLRPAPHRARPGRDRQCRRRGLRPRGDGPRGAGLHLHRQSQRHVLPRPLHGGAFVNVFALNSATEASLNYAKISYYTPRLFGVQLGMSFTPSEGRDVVPFVNKGPYVPDHQTDIWELAASYSDSFGPATLNFSAGWSVAHDDLKTPAMPV